MVNNAGMLGPYEEYGKLPFDEVENLMKVNLISPMYLTQKVVNTLKDQKKSGVILFTSSIHGDYNIGGETMCIPYCISKAGIINLAGMLARNLAPNIRVNTVAPGPVLTPIWDEDSDETKNAIIDKTLIKRWITPEEIADTFIFLAKNEAITGKTIFVNGEKGE